jgi:hypothetical protein
VLNALCNEAGSRSRILQINSGSFKASINASTPSLSRVVWDHRGRPTLPNDRYLGPFLANFRHAYDGGRATRDEISLAVRPSRNADANERPVLRTLVPENSTKSSPQNRSALPPNERPCHCPASYYNELYDQTSTETFRYMTTHRTYRP